jgi:hypothetical protein
VTALLLALAPLLFVAALAWYLERGGKDAGFRVWLSVAAALAAISLLEILRVAWLLLTRA